MPRAMNLQSRIQRLAEVVAVSTLLSLLMVSPVWAQPTPASDTPKTNENANVDPTENEQADNQNESESADGEPKKPKRVLDLSNPRATMRAFLLAAQDANTDSPERIDDAVACMDTSELDGEDVAARQISLARRLHALIDHAGVKLEDIPSGNEQSEYEFFSLPPASDGATKRIEAVIALARNTDTDRWLFTPKSLASIPALEDHFKSIAKAAEPEKNELPAERRSPRATITSFVSAMRANPPNLKEAVLCLDPTDQDIKAWTVRGNELAIKLKNVMDKVAAMVAAEVPDSPDGPPFTWHTSTSGNIVVAPVDGDKESLKKWNLTKGEWRFNPQTLATLDVLYEEYAKKQIREELRDEGITEDLSLGMRLKRQMPDWARKEFVSLELWQWCGLVVLVLTGWLVKIVGALLASFILWLWLHHKNVIIAADVRRQALRSSGAVLTVLFWRFAVLQDFLQLPQTWTKVLVPVVGFGLVLVTLWVGYRIVDVLGSYVASNQNIRFTQYDQVLIPMLRTVLRILVVVIVILFVADYWFDRPPSAVLGALGIGGVALAFAAKDTISNFLGSITVLMDRPFVLGDWVVVGDVEGTVERLGFRSTRVRTFYNSVVTIPNARMADTNVDNYGKRQYRRVRVMLSLTFDTPPEKIDAFCEGIRELIRLHPYTRKDYYHVYFNKFAASSLDVLLYAFFQVPDWSTELRERHKLFNDILRLAKRIGVDFAFPTQTLLMESVGDQAKRIEDATSKTAISDPDEHGIQQAAKLFESIYGPEPKTPSPVIIDRAPKSRKDT